MRGELTAEYLTSLGFKDVIVVGCPSMTMNGRGHRVDRADALTPGSSIAYNLQTNNPFGIDLITDAEANFDATYMPQDLATLEMMLWGTTPYSGHDERLPLSRSHSQFSEAKAQFQLDAPVWIQRMRDMSFSFGPRIHGNVAAILAGTPGLVLAHDGRTLELSRYHGVPTIDLTVEECPRTVAELYSRADYTEFNRGHSERFDRLSDFIHDNGFTHIYDPGQERALADYEDRLASTNYPDPQTSLWHDVPPEYVRMASKLQDRYLALKKAQKAIKANGAAKLPENKLREVESRLDKAEAALGRTQSSVKSVRVTADRADRRVDKMMKVPLGLKKMLRSRRSE
ncbi:polysaccharide pyruvyl transferase family protein [Brevibacterium sp. CBA3109]|uniref:Polysaccharide pyruvyl transferase family protein n=1 Tax=Brevibacterium koreense TaxID=3140787 RepID=A0AAU7UJ50_9MICO